MKSGKIVTIVLAILLISPVMYGQKTVDQLFKEFTKEKGVERVGMGKFVFRLAGLFTDVMGVDGIEVLSFESCDQSFKQRLNNAIASVKDAKYETMVSVNEENERTKILVRIENETIRELIVMTSGNDPALVRIKGKIKSSDIDKVMKNSK